MRTIKQLMIVMLIFPLTAYSQTENMKYEKIIDFVIESIVKNDLDSFYITNTIERKTDFIDFHGISENCEIQHKLLQEILLNGEQSKISESELSALIPDRLQLESKNNKIEFGTIITYKNIWASVIVIRSVSKRDQEWVKYSLLFIDNKLVGKMIGKWHGD